MGHQTPAAPHSSVTSAVEPLSQAVRLTGNHEEEWMRRITALILLVAAGSLTVAACGSDEKEKSASGAKKADTGAKVEFTEPDANTTEGSKGVRAEVKLTDFKVDAAGVGKANKKGSGHLHFSVDGGKFDKPKYSGENGKLAVKLGTDGKYSPAAEPRITYEDLPPGKHTLKVELVNNDHTPAGAEATTWFKVQ